MRYVINTSAAPEHVGGNEKLAAVGDVPRAAAAGGFGGAVPRPRHRRRRSSRTRACSTAMSTPPARRRAAPDGRVAERHVLRRVPQAVRIRERRAGDPLSRASRQHRRRQLRVLPPLGSDQRRQPVLDRQLSADRRRQGRQHPGRDRRPQSHPRPGGRRVPRRRAAPGSFRAAAGCRTPPTSRRIATCW